MYSGPDQAQENMRLGGYSSRSMVKLDVKVSLGEAAKL